MSTILVVDDEEAVCWSLKRALSKLGHRVDVAASAEEAIDLAHQRKPDTILLDVRLPGMDGLTALAHLRRASDDAPVIVMTAFGSLSTAVGAVEGGAYDYLTKPFDLDQALDSVGRALQWRLHEPLQSEPGMIPEEIVGQSPAMQAVFKRIALVAPRDASVLITGESGTGKELVARAIHRHGSRRDRIFLPVHVAALNPSLVESELFGHVKGAFTGATEHRPGLFALADGGTLFLDELADIPLPVQVKLLRVLEQGEILPVGGGQPHKLDIRFLCATHQDLERKVAEGQFRHDLYFRLNVFQIQLPPLRERTEDILPLAEHFLCAFEPGCLPLRDETASHLCRQPWLGNVRELRNALEHAAIMARGGPLLPEHFPARESARGIVNASSELARSVREWVNQRIKELSPGTPTELYSELLAQVEPVLLDEILRRLDGNRWAAAQWLGLNRATVRKKLAIYTLFQDKPDQDTDE